jgi:hypothetical protein
MRKKDVSLKGLVLNQPQSYSGTLRHKISYKATSSETGSTRVMHAEARRISHSSATSEMTFPLRADAYVATDLTPSGHEESVISTDPPSEIPYPFLLQGMNRTGWASPESPKEIHGSFFTSTTKKGSKKSTGISGCLTSLAGLGPVTNKLVRSQPVPPQPRPVNLPPAPLAGGPRSRPLRTPSVIGNRTAMHFASPGDSSFRLSRSPSLPTSTSKGSVTLTSEDFKKQVDRLADVLPHVDRKLLEGYLKHSGQDILAIGQFIEDEKQGSIHYEYLE